MGFNLKQHVRSWIQLHGLEELSWAEKAKRLGIPTAVLFSWLRDDDRDIAYRNAISILSAMGFDLERADPMYPGHGLSVGRCGPVSIGIDAWIIPSGELIPAKANNEHQSMRPEMKVQSLPLTVFQDLAGDVNRSHGPDGFRLVSTANGFGPFRAGALLLLQRRDARQEIKKGAWCVINVQKLQGGTDDTQQLGHVIVGSKGSLSGLIIVDFAARGEMPISRKNQHVVEHVLIGCMHTSCESGSYPHSDLGGAR